MPLKDRYCIAGVGETEYSRRSNRSTRAMAVEAIKKAMHDAGLGKDDVDGMMSYQGGDSTPSNWISGDLGLRLNFYMDVMGGGSSTEALIGLAMGAIEVGMCKTVAIFRSMNGYSDFRIGGTGARAAQPVRGLDLAQVPFGMRSAGQNFAPTFMRHMYEYGTTSDQVAHVRVAHSKHASQNPKALLKDRVTVDDVLSSRWITKPLHLLDCCLETDNATCVIVTSAERARDLKQKPVVHHGRRRPRQQAAHGLPLGARPDLHAWPGYHAKDIVFGQAGIKPEDVHDHRLLRRVHLHDDAPAGGVRVLQEGRGRRVRLERHHRARWQAPQQHVGRPPVRGLHPRDVDGDRERAPAPRHRRRLLPRLGADGKHTYDYSPSRCRQVKDVHITMNLGWAMPPTGSALIMTN